MYHNGKKMNTPTPLSSLLQDGKSGTLPGLVRHCRQLQQLERRLFQCLDDEAVAHCRLANLSTDEAGIAVDSSAWASRLRYQLPQLLACARQLDGLSGVKAMRVVLLAAYPAEAKEPSHQAPRLSRESAHTLLSCAEHIEHPGLSAALKRLASRAG